MCAIFKMIQTATTTITTDRQILHTLSAVINIHST